MQDSASSSQPLREANKIGSTGQSSLLEGGVVAEEGKILKSFTLFPLLIPEIRIQIWATYLQTPRLLTISAFPSIPPNTCNSALSSYPTPSSQSLHIARSAPCSLLAVNSEARHEALTYYSRPPTPESMQRDRLPYHARHKSYTRGFYRNPGQDVVYLQGCFYDSRWFRGVGVVGREVLGTSLQDLTSGSVFSSSSSSRTADRPAERPLVGSIHTLALDEAFLSDETLFGRPEVSPVMLYLMRDLEGLQELLVVRTKDDETASRGIAAGIEGAREKLVRLCEIWGYEEEVAELKRWACPSLGILSREELGRRCGEVVGLEG